MLLFFVLLTLGFIFELGKKALDIPSRQNNMDKEGDSTFRPIVIQHNSFELLIIVQMVVD
jgi:hypothetical protein